MLLCRVSCRQPFWPALLMTVPAKHNHRHNVALARPPPHKPAAACSWLPAYTSHHLPALSCALLQAVEAEDYDEAKRLKAAVDRLRAAGGAIAALEARKRAAVEAEDYDLAKQLKQEVDRMRWVDSAALVRSGCLIGCFVYPAGAALFCSCKATPHRYHCIAVPLCLREVHTPLAALPRLACS